MTSKSYWTSTSSGPPSNARRIGANRANSTQGGHGMREGDLEDRHPVEYPAGTPPLDRGAAERLIRLVPGWTLEDGGKTLRLKRRFEGGFLEAVAFLNKMAPIAEEEDHHPDVRIYSYRWMDVDFSTH